MTKLLLCDDEEALCRGLARLLRAASFEVVTADGPAGLARMERQSFDIILTDLRMPHVNGFDILEAARRKKSPPTPVIVMSGSAEIPDAVRAIRSGARDFLIKPFEFKGLEEALVGALQGATTSVTANLAATDPFAWRDHTARLAAGRRPRHGPGSQHHFAGGRHQVYRPHHR